MNVSNYGVSVKCFRESWKWLLGMAFVYGFQEILRVQFFKCPCTNYWRYSCAMLAAPSFFLLGLGFCCSNNYWMVVQTRRNLTNYKLQLNYCLKSLPSLFEPFLPVVSFIVLVLLKGEYYECAMIGTSRACSSKNGKTSRMTSSKSTDEAPRKFYTQSQLLGCGVLAGVTIFVVGIVFIRGYFFKRDNILDIEEYYLLESELLSTTFREKLKEAIKGEVKRDVDEVFGDLQDRCAEVVFRQARDQIHSKRNVNKVGRFTRLTEIEDGADSSVRILDSSL